VRLRNAASVHDTIHVSSSALRAVPELPVRRQMAGTEHEEGSGAEISPTEEILSTDMPIRPWARDFRR
jgi:hypothetical protein